MGKKGFLTVAAASMIAAAIPAFADTHAPGAQTFDIVCGEQVATFVSPGFHAKAGQDLDSTNVGVAFLITAGGEVVYESPAFAGLPDGVLMACTTGEFTLWFLIPPLEQSSGAGDLLAPEPSTVDVVEHPDTAGGTLHG